MRARTITAIAFTTAIVLLWAACGGEKRVSLSAQSVVDANGTPDLIAKRVELVTETVKRLEIEVSGIDPRAFTNWARLENCVLIWLESSEAREDMHLSRGSLEATGDDYYIAHRSRGEYAKLYIIGTNGTATKFRRLKYEAIGLTLRRPSRASE